MTNKYNTLARRLFGCVSLLIITTLAITACPSPGGGAGGAEGSITINFNTGARTAAWPSEKNAGILPYLEHKVTLTNGLIKHNQTVPRGKTSATFKAIEGTWKVTVEAFYDSYPFAKGVSSVDVKAGISNPCSVTMKQADESAEYLLASDVTEWNDSLLTISNGGTSNSYVIFVVEDIKIQGTTSSTFGNFTGAVTICGDHKLSLTSGSQGSLLHISPNQEVTLYDTDLVGSSFNNNALVDVADDAKFTMMGSSSVSGNTNSLKVGGVYVYMKAVFTMQDNASVYNNTGTGGGVLVESWSTFIMKGNSSVSGNKASSDLGNSAYGGGVYVNYASFTMEDSASVSNNTATGVTSSYGGGVYVNAPSGESSTFTMKGNASVSNNNTATGVSYGGGVYVSGGTFTMQDNAKVYDNKTGGGVYVESGTFTMQDKASVSGNTSINSGSGVYIATILNLPSEFTMKGYSSVSSNTSSSSGGGVYITAQSGISSAFTMQESASVSGNNAYIGGGVYVDDGTFIMSGSSTVSGNTSANAGGGVYIDSSNAPIFSMQGNASVSNNTSGSNGGGVCQYGGTFEMYGSASVSNNTAKAGGSSTANGGGVWLDNGEFWMYGSALVVSGNTCSNDGGGVYLDGNNDFKMIGGTIYGSNEPNASLKNTSGGNDDAFGAAPGKSAQYGTYNGPGTYGYKGTITPTDNTIEVVNGALIP